MDANLTVPFAAFDSFCTVHVNQIFTSENMKLCSLKRLATMFQACHIILKTTMKRQIWQTIINSWKNALNLAFCSKQSLKRNILDLFAVLKNMDFYQNKL